MVIFKILLASIYLTGHIFGYKQFYGKNSIEKEVYLLYLFKRLYPVILFLTLLSWILSGYSIPRIVFLCGLSFTYIVSSILSALASNIFLQKIETKLQTSESRIHYISRLLVLGYGAFCIASSTAVTKSSLYLLEITEYAFEEKMQEIIDYRSGNKIEIKNRESQKLTYFLSDVKQISNDTLNITRKNLFSFITGLYKVKLDDNASFRISYSYSRGDQHFPYDIHTFRYEMKKTKVETEVKMITALGFRLKTVEKTALIHNIEGHISDLDSIVSDIKRKPAGIIEYAYSALMDTIGINGYEFSATSKRTERIDFILKWLFWIITSILFFEFTRNWARKRRTEIS